MRKIIKSNSGVAAVEFAIVAPLLFVLFLGIIEFGAILYNQSVITNASREGARYAATFYTDPNNAEARRPDCSEIKGFVTKYVYAHLLNFRASSALTEGDVLCMGNAGNPYSQDPTYGWVDSIRVVYQYDFLVFGNLMGLLTGGAWSPTLTLRAQTSMRDENQITS